MNFNLDKELNPKLVSFFICLFIMKLDRFKRNKYLEEWIIHTKDYVFNFINVNWLILYNSLQ